MLWIASAMAADCVRPTTEREFTDDLTSASEALESGDAARLKDTLVRLQSTLECVAEPVSPDDVATYRVLLGVQAFGDSATDDAAAQFLAARALSSDLVIPVYPADHEIYGVFRRYDPVRAERRRLPPPRRGQLLLDGLPSRDRYMAAPVFAQHVVDGSVVSASELEAGALPAYPVRHPVRNGLLIATGGLAVGAGSLFAASQASRSSFYSGTHDFAELSTLKSRTNTLATAGIGVSTAAVCTGVTAILFRKR